MRRILPIYLSVYLFISPVITYGNILSLIDNIKIDFIQFMAKNWHAYHVTEYFNNNAKDYSYLKNTFGSSVVSDSQATISTNIQIESEDDTEGGYDLGIISLKYLNKEIAERNFNFIQNATLKNLKGGKIFVGYTSKQCGKIIVILYSKAIVTDVIQTYFSRFRRNSCSE